MDNRWKAIIGDCNSPIQIDSMASRKYNSHSNYRHVIYMEAHHWN